MFTIETAHHNQRIFGIMVRIQRYRAQQSLRTTAEIAGLSHTQLQKIEQGTATITLNTFKKLTTQANFVFSEDKQKNEFLIEQSTALYDAVFLGDIEINTALIAQLRSDETYYMHSRQCVNYALLIAAIYNHPRHQKMDIAKDMLEQLSHVVMFMDNREQQRVNLLTGIHAYHRREVRKARTHLTESLNHRFDNPERALGEYYLGRLHSYEYKLHQAKQLLESAYQKFLHHNNIRRATYARVYHAITSMKLRDLSQVRTTFDTAKAYAVKHRLPGLIHLIGHHELTYALIKKDYQAVIHQAQRTESTYKVLFYTAYAWLQLNRLDYVKHTLKTTLIDQDTHEDHKTLYRLGLRFIETITSKTDNPDILRRFFDKTLQHNALLETEMVYGYLRDYYIRHRQYKQAYQLTETMIKLTQRTMT